LFTPTSLGHILGVDLKIHLATVRPNGTPLLQLSNGLAYAYNKDTQAFEEVCSLRFAQYSSLWTRTRASTTVQKSIVAYLETSLNTLRPDIVADTHSAMIKANTPWFNDATELGHLEMRLQACTTLHSPNEYKTFLAAYSRKIAEEGYKNKAEQLVRDLYGPVS
jgi:protein HIRA/HIR1